MLEEEQVPSTNQFAKMLQINPATAAKGVNVLVDEGILYKREGSECLLQKEQKKSYLKKTKYFYDRIFTESVGRSKSVRNIKR